MNRFRRLFAYCTPFTILVVYPAVRSFTRWHSFSYLFGVLHCTTLYNTVQVISRQVVARAEETSTYSSLGFCTVNCRPMARNYQLSHVPEAVPETETPASEVGSESVTTLPPWLLACLHSLYEHFIYGRSL